MKKIIISTVSILSAVSLVSCGPRGNKANVELIQNMMVQENVKPQEHDEYFANGVSQLIPPEHTQPVGFKPYKWGMDLAAAIRENKNPMSGDMTPEVLVVGQKYFETHCMVCHGQKGLGDGPIKASYPLPIPPLVSDKVKGLPDAHIYHIITMGQGVMGPYASHVPQAYRWQVVNYIRFLQKNN